MFLFYSLQEELLVLVGELLALKTAKDKKVSIQMLASLCFETKKLASFYCRGTFSFTLIFYLDWFVINSNWALFDQVSNDQGRSILDGKLDYMGIKNLSRKKQIARGLVKCNKTIN